MRRHCLILTPEFPPLSLGGVARYTSEVATRLGRHMRVSVIVVPTYQALAAGSCFDAAPTHTVRLASSAYRSALLGLAAANRLGPLLEAAAASAAEIDACLRADEELVIYAQDYALAPLAAALLARHPAARLIAACHLPVYAGFTYFDKPVSDAIHQVLEAGLVQLAHRVVVPSAFAAHVLEITHNLARGKLAVLALGVARPRPPVALSDGPLRLLAVGRATEQKGYHLMFEALAQLQRRQAHTRLTVAAGSDSDRLRALAARHAVAALVEFAPQQAHDEIWALYDSHHLLLSTSLYETFGLAVLEAMASARPTIGFAIGALPELWGPQLTARLGTPVARVDALVERLAAIAAAPAELHELAGCVAARAAAFSWDSHLEGLLAVMAGSPQASGGTPPWP